MVIPDWLQGVLTKNHRHDGVDDRVIRLSHPQAEGLDCVRLEARAASLQAPATLQDSLLIFHEVGGCALEIRCQHHGWRYVAEAGTFDYLPAGPYALIGRGPQPSRSVILRIPDAFEQAVQQDEEWVADLLPRPGLRDGRLRALLVSLLAASTAAGPWSVILSAALANRLYERIYARSRRDSVVLTRTIRRLIAEYVEQNLGHPAHLGAVTELTGLSRTQFGKAFAASFGTSLHRYVTQRRMAIAAERLESPDVSLTQLANDLGFSSHAHFSTTFRQHFSRTPSDWRRLSLAERSCLRPAECQNQPSDAWCHH